VSTFQGVARVYLRPEQWATVSTPGGGDASITVRLDSRGNLIVTGVDHRGATRDRVKVDPNGKITPMEGNQQ
jgi:hypothetical protein